MGVPGDGKGCASAPLRRRPGAACAARQHAVDHPGEGRRHVRHPELVSGAVPVDAQDRAIRQQGYAGARLRIVSSPERRGSRRIRLCRGSSGRLFHSPDGRLEERRPQVQRHHGDHGKGHHGCGDQGCRRLFRRGQAEPMDPGGRDRRRAEVLHRPGQQAACSPRRRRRTAGRPHHRSAGRRGGRGLPRSQLWLRRLRAERQHRQGQGIGEHGRRQDDCVRHLPWPDAARPGRGARHCGPSSQLHRSAALEHAERRAHRNVVGADEAGGRQAEQ